MGLKGIQVTAKQWALKVIEERDSLRPNVHGRALIADIADLEPYFQKAMDQMKEECADRVEEAGRHFQKNNPKAGECGEIAAFALELMAKALRKEEEGDMKQKPSIGRIVHAYGQPISTHSQVPQGPEAAIIVGLYPEEEKVDLVVLQSNGIFHQNKVGFSETPTPYSWTWPPRV